MSIFAEILNNKLLLYSVIAVILFIVISIILIKKVCKQNDEEVKVDIEKIDGENSIFDEIIEEKEKSNGNQLDLDSMIEKMQKDLDAKASEVVEKFENEQEEKSVISYQELIGNKQEEYNSIKLDEDSIIDEPVSQIMDETYENSISEDINTNSLLTKLERIENDINDDVLNQPIEIEKNEEKVISSKLNMKDEFVEAIKTGNYEEIKSEMDIKEEKQESEPVTKFKATEFISPIYGVQDIKMQYPTVQNMRDFKENFNKYNKFEVDNTLSTKKVNNEVHKDEDFLNSLKEFRKNLE